MKTRENIKICKCERLTINIMWQYKKYLTQNASYVYSQVIQRPHFQKNRGLTSGAN